LAGLRKERACDGERASRSNFCAHQRLELQGDQ